MLIFQGAFWCGAPFTLTAVDCRARLLEYALQRNSCHLPHRVLSSLIFQQARNISANRAGMAGELRKCCASVQAGERKHFKKAALWLACVLGARPVMPPYVWSVTMIRAHHFCLRKVRGLSSSTFLFVLSLAIDKTVLRTKF